MSRPSDFFWFEKGQMTCEGVALEEIAKKVGTPTYVYSASSLLNQFEKLRRGLSGLDSLICFAVKSNSNLSLLRLLGNTGAGMDLVSGGELFRVDRAGIPGERIVFSGIGKTREEMEQALTYKKNGILSFHVESIPELEALSAVALKMGRVAPIALRFNPDVNPKTHPYISTGLKKNKFGLDRSEILKIARNETRYPGAKLHGLSIHIGSQLLSLSPLKDAFVRLYDLADEMNGILREPISLLDFGGGLGISYQNECPPKIEDYCALARQCFKNLKMRRPLQLLFEPGRVISGNAGALLTRVLYKKEKPRKNFLVVDAGMNDLIRPSLYGSYHEIVPVTRKSGQLQKADVVGPVCESSDCFAFDRKLPASLGSGDLLAILSAGAYGFTMAGNYNSRPRPPEVLVRNGKFKIIRERESYADLVRGE